MTRPTEADERALVGQQFVEIAPRKRAIEKAGEQERVCRRQRGRFRRCRDAAVDSVEQDHRHQQRGKRAERDPRQRLQRHARLHRKRAAACDAGVEDHQHQAHQKARQDAAEKEVSDRAVGDERVEHHRDRRRDDRADGRGGRRDRGRVSRRIVAVARHQADDDLADARRVRDRRTGHAGKDQVGDDVDVAEPAAEAADDRHAELEQALADRAGVHDVGGGDEQRHREQHEAVVEALDVLLGGERQVLAVDREVGDRRHDHGQRDRRADARHDEQRQQAKSEGGAHASGRSRSCGSARRMRRHRRHA